MSASKRPPRNKQPSIAYRSGPVKGAYFDLADPGHEGQVAAANIRQNATKAELKSTEMLTTREFISAAGEVWSRINPLPVLEPKSKLNYNDRCHKNVVLGDMQEVIGEVPTLDSVHTNHLYADLRNARNSRTVVQSKFDFLKVSQNLSPFEPGDASHASPLFWMCSKQSTIFSNSYERAKGLGSIGISCELKYVNDWMKEIVPSCNISKVEEAKNSRSCSSGIRTSSAEGCILAETTGPVNSTAFKRDEIDMDSVKSIDTLLSDYPKGGSNTGITSSLYSDYLLGVLPDNKMNTNLLSAPSSILFSDYHIGYLSSCKSMHKNFQNKIDNNEMPNNLRMGLQNFVIEEKCRMEMNSSQQRPQYCPAKQEHAFAGAFAGIFVSVCLHPVDTIKTILQSCHAEQRPIWHIGRSIVSERGVTALYRGITSNIASSAPISAIYTFTYESVKGNLLPLFSKEYQSFAHCIAGGCASLATSFVFTPSEHIKQQMQIGSRYQNCWNVLVGIIGKGGISSLYTGWVAVLCRNIPHSIIKFYTYESLKHLMLSSQHSSNQPKTLQTLVCGGVAGSTAALFTTPFDVVKTRLQTQIPGSMSQYDNVFHALVQIGRNEGFKGLYRGLMPRLVMYMSQGALFFTSYESFKRLFGLEMPWISTEYSIQRRHEEDMV